LAVPGERDLKMVESLGKCDDLLGAPP